MFKVEGTNIIVSRGDTGALRMRANVTRLDTGAAYTFGERDRALFSIKTGQGQLVREKAYPMTNNVFIVVFTNQDTENLQAGSGYTWDVRYMINPHYDTDPPEGPWPEYSTLTFPVAQGTKCIRLGVCYTANQEISTAEEWTSEHWTEYWTDYGDLTFPVAQNTRCSHNGTYYYAKQAISTSEEWTPSHWFFADYRKPVDGDQVITPKTPMNMNLLTVVGEV